MTINQKVGYPIILHPETEGGYSVEIPDINGGSWTQGDSIEEAIEMGKDLIGTMLLDETALPASTPLNQLAIPAKSFAVRIIVDLTAYRQTHAAV